MRCCVRDSICIAALSAVRTGRVAAGVHDRSTRAGGAGRGADWCGRACEHARGAPAGAGLGGDSRGGVRVSGRGDERECPCEDRREPVAAAAARAGAQLRRCDADAHLAGVDGGLLSDLRDRPEHVRRQLAAAGLDPQAGERVLDRAEHLPRAELRPLLRRADAVQRHQRGAGGGAGGGRGSHLLGIWSRTRTPTANVPRTTTT